MAQPRSYSSSKSVRSTVANCQGDVCDCLRDAMERLSKDGHVPHGSGSKGFLQLFREQTEKGAAAPGSSTWNSHQQTLASRQQTLQDYKKEFEDQGCGGGLPQSTQDSLKSGLPTQADWDFNNANSSSFNMPKVPAPSPWTWGAVGLGTLLLGGAMLAF